MLIAFFVASQVVLYAWINPLDDVGDDRVKLFVSGSCGGSLRHFAMLQDGPKLQNLVVAIPINSDHMEMTMNACAMSYSNLVEKHSYYRYLLPWLRCKKLEREAAAWFDDYGLSILPGIVIDGKSVSFRHKEEELRKRGIEYGHRIFRPLREAGSRE